ncbi:MAG: NAD(P)-dependent alcohol dehydrogenase [Holophagales bacterium]|nr:NAD(P)-dependent alcohol dehydrogenase [Holophagales bacterium]
MRPGTMRPATMRAATFDCYGSPDVIKVEEMERPRCGPGEVLVAVRAASVNPFDWHRMTGTPYLVRMQGGWTRPKSRQLGIDVAGVIVSAGENVTRLAVGDEVFGSVVGAFAEYVAVQEDGLVPKPAGITFEEAAAVPTGALTAVQGLRDHGRLEPGQHVLINGAAGGVGTYAVQLAKHFGAEVTGVCSTRNVGMVRGLGADHVVDYTTDDFTADRSEYDLILDNMGNRRIAHYKRCLSPTGTFVVVGGPKGRLLGPLLHMAKVFLAFRVGQRRAALFMAQNSLDDLELFRDLLDSGAMRSVIDTVYPLDQTTAAVRHLETGHARGKIIITP